MNTFLDITYIFLQHLRYSPALGDDINKVLPFFRCLIVIFSGSYGDENIHSNKLS